jgi:nitronate monooxygenase
MTSPLHTPLCDVLGIEHPVLLAPMANGPSTPELAAAVSRAGGLGVLAGAGLTAAAVQDEIGRARELGATRIGVNVQVPPARHLNPDAASVQAVVAPFREELGLPAQSPAAPPPADPPLAVVQAALEAGADVLSAALGDPAGVVELGREAGVPVVAMVTTVDEALRAAELGADVVIAQGAEAGGHRSTFDLADEGPPPLVGTIALVPLVVDAVAVPVVAAGGIADGRGLAAALALGAQGASVGTRFIAAEESGAPAHYRQRLLELRPEDTVVTDQVTGRPARWIRNRFVDAMEAGPRALGWPAQGAAIGEVRREAARQGRSDVLAMLAGQGAALSRRIEPAEAIVAEMVRDAARILGRD